MTEQACHVTSVGHCRWCRWDGPQRETAREARRDVRGHTETGQHHRNAERHEDGL